MRILVTGGTGFVGSHVVAALVHAGHHVTLLVRSAGRMAPALSSLGVRDVSHVLGDVVDAASVSRAMEGCDAVVHAASVYSFDPRRADAMRRVNVPGTEVVLDEAARRRLDPIVYVSSTVAFLPGDGTPVGPDSPVGDPSTTYARTKADGERVARARQEREDPVAIVYPGMVWGPGDPHMGETALLARDLLRRRVPVLPGGGLHVVDVREVAATIRALIESGRGARRCVVPGHHATLAALVAGLAEATGRRLKAATVSARALMPGARVADLVQRASPVRLPVSAEAIYTTGCDLRFDDTHSREELGVSPRPLHETLADTARWLHGEGHIGRRQAGVLAGT